MNAEKFWLTWLKITITIVIIAGIALAFLSRTSLYDVLNKQINHIFYADNPPDFAVKMMQSRFVTIMGALMAVYGIAILYLTCYSLQKKELWAWRCILYSFIIWFIIDTSVSFFYQSGISIIINIVFFFQVLAPLLFLKKSFEPNPRLSV